MAVLPEYKEDSGFQIPGVVAPDKSQQLQDILSYQSGLAQQARANAQRDIQNQYKLYEDNARKQLASNIQGVKKDYNRRGLLHSGMRRGAEFGQQAASKADLANARFNTIPTNVMNNIRTLEGNAAQTGYAMAGVAPNLGAYSSGQLQGAANQSIADSGNEAALYGGLAKGLGNLAGSMAAYRRS